MFSRCTAEHLSKPYNLWGFYDLITLVSLYFQSLMFSLSPKLGKHDLYDGVGKHDGNF